MFINLLFFYFNSLIASTAVIGIGNISFKYILVFGFALVKFYFWGSGQLFSFAILGFALAFYF